LERSRFAEAQRHLQRALELLPADDPFRQTVQGQLKRCEQLIALDSKLAAILKGKQTPADVAEQLALADLCRRYKKRYADAARFYAAAFAAQPALADDLSRRLRYHAAGAAALAGCGQGKDADTVDDEKRTHLRQQALAWLQEELMKWTKVLEDNPDKARAAVQQTLQHWQKDADLTGVRGDALAKLPEAERKEWQQLWDDVEALRQRAAGPK
jgi:hypothetical protein